MGKNQPVLEELKKRSMPSNTDPEVLAGMLVAAEEELVVHVARAARAALASARAPPSHPIHIIATVPEASRIRAIRRAAVVAGALERQLTAEAALEMLMSR